MKIMGFLQHVRTFLADWQGFLDYWLWGLLALCVLSCTAGLLLGAIGARCGERYRLMTALGVSCGLSFMFRIYLIMATLLGCYEPTFRTLPVQLVMHVSSFGSTMFYACLIAATFHTFCAITVHPTQYNAGAASRLYVRGGACLGAMSVLYKLYFRARLDGPFSLGPLTQKPLNYLNLFLLLVIGAACPVFLIYMLIRFIRTRRASQRIQTHCSIKLHHIYRLLATLVGLVGLSAGSLATIIAEASQRNFGPLDLSSPPSPQQVALRYTWSSATGIVLFLIYITGDELQLTVNDILRHEQRTKAGEPCDCRACLGGGGGDPEDPVEGEDSGSVSEVDFASALFSPARRDLPIRSPSPFGV